jgi:hypothetical protein
MPVGVRTAVQLDAPSVVRATVPVTWSTSTDVWAVTQQERLSEHEISVAPFMPGSDPAWVQVEVGELETRVTTLSAPVPAATHQPSGRQVTAVRSRMPAGTGTEVQTDPPLEVTMITA